MNKIELARIARYYKNNGQEAERVVRYTLTGRLEHADNHEGADCMGYQIKTSKASICKGLDIRAHVAHDEATGYVYVLADLSTAYFMNADEYVAFIDLFAHADRDSNGKNHGNVKLRLKTENRAMREWLASHTLRHYEADTGRDWVEFDAHDYADAECALASMGYYVPDCIIYEWTA